MHPWLPAALFALAAWSFQRLLSKRALTGLGTRKFYLLSAVVSLLVYLPYVVTRRPAAVGLPPAFGLACLMAATFGVTSEAIRRGPLGVVSPITALSPALTAVLGIAVLGERLDLTAYLGIGLAPAGIGLLASRPGGDQRARGWLLLALVSLVMQGVGAFLARLVVTPAGPSGLLLAGASVQVLIGLVLAPPHRWRRSDLSGRPALFTVLGYAIGGVATIGYLLALSEGPASVIVPLVSVSPALAGLLAIPIVKEPAGLRQWCGIGIGLVGATLLASV